MDPLVGIILIVAWSALNGLIASKRQRSGGGFFLLSVAPVIPLWFVVVALSKGQGSIAEWCAFIPPAVGLIAALSVKPGLEVAASEGSYGNFVRCPFCAEAIRRAATKCKHCGSDIPSTAIVPVKPTSDPG